MTTDDVIVAVSRPTSIRRVLITRRRLLSKSKLARKINDSRIVFKTSSFVEIIHTAASFASSCHSELVHVTAVTFYVLTTDHLFQPKPHPPQRSR